MPIEALRQNIRTIRTLSSTTKEPEAALKAQAKGYEDLMVGADDLQQAELLAKWTSNVGVLQRARYPSAEAWLALINRFYGLQNGDITPGSLGGPDPDPGVSQSGINPLELGLGIGACLLAAAGPGGVAAVAVMTAMSQIFGGGSEIDWNMVFSRIRSIVREEVQDIQVQNLGYEVKTLGDWMTSSLVAHPEWRPESGQFQDKLVEAQVLSGKLMYAQGSNGTQASALGFFMVAANIHLALLVAAADCSKRDGKADAARGYLDELVSYSERYARHARRLAHYLISQRSWSFQGVGGWPIPFVVREREAIFARVKGAPASLYMRLVRNYMRAAMANTLDTVEAWGRLADKARGGEIVAGVKATITPPASPPDLTAPVQLFVHGFDGPKMDLFVGRYDYAAIAAKIGNDTVSSVKVRPGYRLTLYKDAGFSGIVRDYVCDMRSLPGFNDQASSAIVERVWATADPVMLPMGNSFAFWIGGEKTEFALFSEKSGLAVTQRASDVSISQQPWVWGGRQKWRFRRNSDGTYRIENVDSGQVLGLKVANKNQGTDVVAAPWSEAPWRPTAA